MLNHVDFSMCWVCMAFVGSTFLSVWLPGQKIFLFTPFSSLRLQFSPFLWWCLRQSSRMAAQPFRLDSGSWWLVRQVALFFLNSFLRYNLHTLKFTCFKNTVQLLPVTENLKSPVFLLYSRTSTIRHTSDTRVVSHSPPVLILPTWREHQTPQVWGLVLQGCPPCLWSLWQVQVIPGVLTSFKSNAPD